MFLCDSGIPLHYTPTRLRCFPTLCPYPVMVSPYAMPLREINGKRPQSQCSLYQECGFQPLISQCPTLTYAWLRCWHTLCCGAELRYAVGVFSAMVLRGVRSGTRALSAKALARRSPVLTESVWLLCAYAYA
eukprot:84681-Rhodomonas_salina.1